eukprot:11716846-Ditylum_brightwellii.AAC.1
MTLLAPTLLLSQVVIIIVFCWHCGADDGNFDRDDDEKELDTLKHDARSSSSANGGSCRDKIIVPVSSCHFSSLLLLYAYLQNTDSAPSVCREKGNLFASNACQSRPFSQDESCAHT